MEFEVYDPSEPDVTFAPVKVAFPAYQFYRDQAKKVAGYIGSITVTEDNIKSVKKDLAKARKITDELDKRRIAIKKEILAPFDEFEREVKDIADIIDTADKELRGKVKELDEQERERKKEQIREIWNKRIGMYRIGYMFPDAFSLWINPIHLNKSVSLKAVETDMIDWLERTEKDLNTLDGMDDEYLVEYLGCLNLADAIAAVNARNEIRKTVRSEDQEESEDKRIFIIEGKKNIKMVEMLLNENEIEYEERKF